MKTLSFILFILSLTSAVSQNINYEWVNVKLYRPPLHPLPINEKTFSVAITDLGNQFGTAEMESLQQKIALPGFMRVREHAAVKVQVIFSGASITSKELKDNPRTVEKDGVKTIYHQYHYLLGCAFPTKVRLNVNGQYIDQDLPAFFEVKYHGRNANQESAFIEEYERDRSFRQSVYREKLSERIKEINTMLSTHYGYTMHPEHFTVGYVKEKHGEYADISRGMALVRDLLVSVDGKEQYINEGLRTKAAEASAVFEKALTESSGEKKSRINPKVTAMIHHNLALISFVLQEFEVARQHLQQAKKGSGGTYAEATSLYDKNADYEKRILAGRNAPSGATMELRVESPPARSSKVCEENYIIGKQNDTLQVAFMLPPSYEMPFGDSVWMQDQIIIESDEKPVTITPEQIQGFYHNGVYHEAVWWIDDLTVQPWRIAHKFCRRIVPGAIPVFACHQIVADDEGYNKVLTSHYYRDGEEGYKEAMFLSFKRGVSKLVAGYPELSEKVRNGEFTRDDFIAIVQAYNKYKESQKTPAP